MQLTVQVFLEQETGAAESLAGGSPLGKFIAQMDLLAEATVTPSGMDEELRCHAGQCNK